MWLVRFIEFVRYFLIGSRPFINAHTNLNIMKISENKYSVLQCNYLINRMPAKMTGNDSRLL